MTKVCESCGKKAVRPVLVRLYTQGKVLESEWFFCLKCFEAHLEMLRDGFGNACPECRAINSLAIWNGPQPLVSTTYVACTECHEVFDEEDLTSQREIDARESGCVLIDAEVSV